jgi:endoglucanase Acf2
MDTTDQDPTNLDNTDQDPTNSDNTDQDLSTTCNTAAIESTSYDGAAVLKSSSMCEKCQQHIKDKKNLKRKLERLKKVDVMRVQNMDNLIVILGI